MNFGESNFIPIHVPGQEAMILRTKRADAVANRELILDTAQRLFADHGVSNVCMSTIAQAAGVGKGTLYRGFANKGELCLALMDEDMRKFQNGILQLLRKNYNQPALTRLNDFLDRLVHFMDFHAPLMQEVEAHNILRDEHGDMPLSWLQQTVTTLLEQAEKNGEIANLDIPYLTDAILAPLQANLFIYQREVMGFSLNRISRGLRKLVIGGVKNRG